MTAAPGVAESALIVRVAAAEPLVAALRQQFDPAARLGVPAHITVLYPFVPPERIDAAVALRIAAALAGAPPFAFRLLQARRFPEVVYLAPEPAAPFAALTAAIVAAFPDHPPYGGRYPTVIPHLTVAHVVEQQAATVARQLDGALRATGGVTTDCAGVELLVNTTGRWHCRQVFPLATPA